MNPTRLVTIQGLASVEHRRDDGQLAAYTPKGPVPMPIRAGDRLRVCVETERDASLYAIGAARQSEFWKVGEWTGVGPIGRRSRHLWPGGRTLSDDDVRMTSLLVIASNEPLPWAAQLTRTECTELVGQMPSAAPATPCDHLYGLFWKVPRRARGLVPPLRGWLEEGGERLPAELARQSGSPYAVIEWQFKARP